MSHAFEHAHESPPVTTVPLLVLAIGAIGAGLAFAPDFIDDGYAKFWRAALFTLPDNSVLADSHNVELLLMKWLPTLMMLGGFPARLYLLYRPAGAPRLDRAQFQADLRLPL